MDNLNTVADMIGDARQILLDATPPFRYSDTSLITALNMALLEARRIRADLFVYKHHNKVPFFTAVNGEPIPVEPQYRLAIAYGIVAHAMLRDEEDIPVERANSFRMMFQSSLTGVMMAPSAPTRPTQQAAS